MTHVNASILEIQEWVDAIGRIADTQNHQERVNEADILIGQIAFAVDGENPMRAAG